MSRNALKWLETLGGPFLLLATDHLRLWHGNDGDGATDYDRLGKILNTGNLIEPIELIKVGDATCLVLSENLRTTWAAPRGTRPGMFVGWRHADGEPQVIAALKEIPDDIFTEKTLRLTIESRKNRLFDSVYAGPSTAKEGYLEVNLKPGEYEAQAGYLEPDSRLLLLITRLVRLDDGR